MYVVVASVISRFMCSSDVVHVGHHTSVTSPRWRLSASTAMLQAHSAPELRNRRLHRAAAHFSGHQRSVPALALEFNDCLQRAHRFCGPAPRPCGPQVSAQWCAVRCAARAVVRVSCAISRTSDAQDSKSGGERSIRYQSFCRSSRNRDRQRQCAREASRERGVVPADGAASLTSL